MNLMPKKGKVGLNLGAGQAPGCRALDLPVRADSGPAARVHAVGQDQAEGPDSEPAEISGLQSFR